MLPLGELVAYLVLHLVEQPLDRVAPPAEGFEYLHLYVGDRAREEVRVVRLLLRHVAAAVARPEVTVPDSAALLEAEAAMSTSAAGTGTCAARGRRISFWDARFLFQAQDVCGTVGLDLFW